MAVAHSRGVLVVVFLRGGADGLNMIVPHGDDAYYDLRPTLAIARPNDSSPNDSSRDDPGADSPSPSDPSFSTPSPSDPGADTDGRAIDLDGFFGLHPALAPLLDPWRDGSLAVVHACGAPDESRSHFRAMDLMERGVGDGHGPPSGWLSRFLAARGSNGPSPVRAVGLGESVPLALRGPVAATSVRSTDDFRLTEDPRIAGPMLRVLTSLYAGDDVLATSARSSLAAVRALSELRPSPDAPLPGVDYPDTDFGRHLALLAMLANADVGLEVAAVDLGGWDTHFAQGSTGTGLMPSLLTELGTGLAALRADLSTQLDQLTVVVMTEFGRRAGENASLGTDHGHGSVMLVMGGGVNGGKVYGRWPGLGEDALVGPGDLAITTDYRDVLAEICVRETGAEIRDKIMAEVFPGHRARPVGLMG